MTVKPDYSRQVDTAVWNEKKNDYDYFWTVADVAVGDWVWAEYNMGHHEEDKTLIKWGKPTLKQVNKVTPKGFGISALMGGSLGKNLIVDPSTGFSKDKQVRVRMKASPDELAARDKENAEFAERRRAMDERHAQPDYMVASYMTGFGAISPEEMLEKYGYDLLREVALKLGYREAA